ncbi:MAG TPA: queuosine precursor transporter, partial [Anaerolineaceae bacterium]|nr:queuosine precursor transporter [Anaerolineaceae bacterium]
KGKLLWARTISSTIVGEILDSLVFILVASLTKVFPWELFWTLVITNYIFKVLVEVLMTPVTYRVIALLKKSENLDGYSDLKDLNPLKL